MTSRLRITVTTFGLLLTGASVALTAQTGKPPAKPSPATSGTKPAPATPNAKPAPVSVVPNQGKAPVTEVLVELRADGLAYLPGAKQPFTGKAITASKNFEDCVESITPYKNGRLHGEVMTLYKAGNPRTVRTYVDGTPKKHVAYYQDGAKKIEHPLNPKNLAEGLYRRWFPSGQLQVEAVHDDQERWHGDNKEYLLDGKLKAHYVFEHGTIQKIVYESPAVKAEREAPPKPPAVPKNQAAGSKAKEG